jgi:hypothetical protein
MMMIKMTLELMIAVIAIQTVIQAVQIHLPVILMLKLLKNITDNNAL